MKLKPRMQVAEHPDCFVVSTYVPRTFFLPLLSDYILNSFVSQR